MSYTIKLHIVHNTTKVKDAITDIAKGDSIFEALSNMYNLHKDKLINKHICRIEYRDPEGYRYVVDITKKGK